jgi:hypothetical protein
MTKNDDKAHLHVTIGEGILKLHLQIRWRWLLVILAAIATLTGSPLLMEILGHLPG